MIQGNAARCAVELAVLDAYGRALGEPLTKVTELVAPDLYQFRDQVQYSAAITRGKGWKARVYSLLYRVFGLRQVKLKVGIPGYDDVKRMKMIRRWLGSR